MAVSLACGRAQGRGAGYERNLEDLRFRRYTNIRFEREEKYLRGMVAIVGVNHRGSV